LKRRFHDRSKRIQRRLERDKFKILLMPLALLALFVSMVALAAAALNHSVHGHGSLEVLLVALGLLFLVVLFFAYRVIRGHYNEELNEP
jgi:hypothetical protein